jgi:hypothetical protein
MVPIFWSRRSISAHLTLNGSENDSAHPDIKEKCAGRFRRISLRKHREVLQ